MNVGLYLPSYSPSLTGNFARMNDVLRFARQTDDDRVQFTVFPGVIRSDADGYTEERVEFYSNDRWLNTLSQFRNVLKYRDDIDVVHVVGAGLGSIPFVLTAINKPVVFGPNIAGRMFPWETHSSPQKEVILSEKAKRVKKMNLYGERLQRLKLKLMTAGPFSSTRIVSFSEYMKRDNLEHRGVPADIISVLPSGVCRDVFQPVQSGRYDTDCFQILFVGRPGRPSLSKGLDLLITAVDKLRDVDWSLTILGHNGPHERVTDSYRANADRIEFVGTVPRRELSQYYNRADVYVCPSIGELESTTMIEALSCGTPCIATDELSFREIAAEGNTVFFENRNVESLARSLRTVQHKETHYRENALQQSTRYDIESTYEHLVDVYTDVFEEHKGKRTVDPS